MDVIQHFFDHCTSIWSHTVQQAVANFLSSHRGSRAYTVLPLISAKTADSELSHHVRCIQLQSSLVRLSLNLFSFAWSQLQCLAPHWSTPHLLPVRSLPPPAASTMSSNLLSDDQLVYLLSTLQSTSNPPPTPSRPSNVPQWLPATTTVPALRLLRLSLFSVLAVDDLEPLLTPKIAAPAPASSEPKPSSSKSSANAVPQLSVDSRLVTASQELSSSILAVRQSVSALVNQTSVLLDDPVSRAHISRLQQFMRDGFQSLVRHLDEQFARSSVLSLIS